MSDAVSAPVRRKAGRHGTMAFLERDLFVGRSLDLYGEYSEREIALFAQFLRPAMTVIEIGANIGAHTIALARMVGAAGTVVAVEPQGVIFQLLCDNLAANGLHNVRTHRAAAGAAAGTLTVPPLDYAGAYNFGGVALAEGGAGETVPVLTVDALALPAAHLLKIDVEGMEAEVLVGAAMTITRHRPILSVENDRRDTSPILIGMLDALGYRCWWHTPPLFNPDNFAGNPDNVFPGMVSVNLLCLPKEAGAAVTGLREVSGPTDWFHGT